MKITDIDIHRVTLQYDEARAYELIHYHDLTQRTIYDADRIAVIDKGRVVEFGSHAELIALDGIYKRMVDKQMRAGTA